MGTVRYTVVNGAVLSENRSGVKRDYVPDPLGSTVALLDNTQTKTDTFQYWPYGEVASRTGTTTTPFQYVGTSGYYRDSASRTYVRARELNTSQGRWMTQDPIDYLGGDWNLYRYVKNNPVSIVDPNGHQTTNNDYDENKLQCYAKARSAYLNAILGCELDFAQILQFYYNYFRNEGFDEELALLLARSATISINNKCLANAEKKWCDELKQCDRRYGKGVRPILPPECDPSYPLPLPRPGSPPGLGIVWWPC